MSKVRIYSAMPLPVAITTGFACAITSPADGASVTQGAPVTIQGTISRGAVVVQVKLGSTVLGSASIVGLTWSYSWTPQSGDIGAQTINAVATSPSSEVAAATGVAVTVSSGIVSPLVTMAGSIKAMHEAATGLTTSGWSSQSPSGSPLAAGGGILVGSDGGGAYAQATGTQYLTSGWTPPGFGTSPVVIDVIVQQDAFSNGAPFVSCGVGGPCAVRQGPSSGNMQINNGSNIAAVFALGAFKRIRAIFTGATSGTADSVQVASASPVTGFAGSTAPSGLSIGAANGSFFTGKWRAVYAYSAIPSGPQAAALDAYYTSLYGAGILT